jgi:hypothetical protein
MADGSAKPFPTPTSIIILTLLTEAKMSANPSFTNVSSSQRGAHGVDRDRMKKAARISAKDGGLTTVSSGSKAPAVFSL